MQYTIDLNKKMMLRFLRKYLILVLLFGLLTGGVTAAAIAKFHQTEYSSSGVLSQNDNNYAIISSYQQFVTSSKFTTVLDKTVDNGKWKHLAQKRDYQISISTSGDTNTPFFYINVVHTNKAYAQYLATVAVKLFMTNIVKYLSGANISIISPVTQAKRIGSSNILIKYAFVGAGAGMIVALLYALFDMFLFGKVPDKDYIEDIYQIKMLGSLNRSK
ncbi:hypothetical protein FBR4_1386 [Lactiplantibacillus plantarum]|uniref:hypothetical protein n=1 Tax=Lactiplantibacillus TaxID=2767842 RepID=UPI0007AC21BC|nr:MULTISPECIES: hypothetical protein [Lactiplantibacillus]AXH03884.1 hypothetical protein CEB41_05085 [Lactiplantibacillus plantarum]KZD97332.1 hypothetical protein FBR4_1386 [Lactiplantibacillus plantarum]MBP5818122.1 hypothetical protein [Lactiplantibacillus plantarum]MBU5277023.1 hypothetical protein [Lactiplantibacillus argentoratensis]MDY2578351.1 hypothetical protein [Lactiplantibacillus plantarum]